MRKLIAVAAIAVTTLSLAGCMEDNSGQAKDSKARQAGFDFLQAKQPAEYMAYSPTRNGIKFFADKWGHDPNKLSYVYLLNMNGDVIGYYVLKGLPISYCAQMLPPTEASWGSSGAVTQNPKPAVDGAYYSGNSGCDQYYGIDATTNSYVEWTQKSGTVLVHEQPIGRPDTDRRALGPTTIGQERR